MAHKGKQKSRRRRGHRPELLAPAGTWETLWAAVEHGADAVYVGLKRFNARALARNFTLDEIAWMVQELHGRGRRLLVAFNSLLKDGEMGEAFRDLVALAEMGVDGIILQDLGLWHLARRHLPELPLHASTLMTIHNSLGVRQAASMGFRRVVLAREMTLPEIEAAVSAASTSSLEIEVFVHGAMCFTISGRCLLSSFSGGKGSTRGKCVQPCRRRYRWGRREGHFFSMADLCGLEAVPALAEMGVDSLKIEGRLRPAPYTAAVVRAYRMVLDALPEVDGKVMEEARAMLSGAMGRRLSHGFFFSPTGQGVIEPSMPSNTGELVGTIRALAGDEVELRPGRGVGDRGPDLASGDRLRLVSRKGEQCVVECKGLEEREGALWLRLAHLPQWAAPGQALYRFNRANSPLVDPQWKARRGKRRIAGLLKGASRRAKELVATPDGRGNARSKGPPKVVVRARRPEPWMAGAHAVILELSRENLKRIGRLHPSKAQVVWFLPPIVWEDHVEVLRSLVRQALHRGFRRFQVSNLGHLALFQGERRVRLLGSYHLNLMNRWAVQAAISMGITGPELSVELDLEGLASTARSSHGCGLTVFGHIPLFTSRVSHPLFDPRTQAVSPKGERYRWVVRGGLGHLLGEAPISLARHLVRHRIPLDFWVVDLLLAPPRRSRGHRLDLTPKGVERLRGGAANLYSGLK